MTQEPKIPKRVEKIVKACTSGKILCRFNRQTAAGDTEIVFFLEPGGKKVGQKSAQQAIASGLLSPRNDGLFGSDTSQTWGPA